MIATLRALAMLVPAIALCACATDGTEQESKYARSVMQCPHGETLICEVRNTGRIRHGSFSKGGKNCTCEVPREGGTIIPSVNQ